MSRNCCKVCPNRPTCQELEDFLFAAPEDFMDMEMVRPPNPICPNCFTELPVSRICGVCE